MVELATFITDYLLHPSVMAIIFVMALVTVLFAAVKGRVYGLMILAWGLLPITVYYCNIVIGERVGPHVVNTAFFRLSLATLAIGIIVSVVIHCWVVCQRYRE